MSRNYASNVQQAGHTNVDKNKMHEWKTGTLHSGSKKGKVVKSKAQAIAIALSEDRKAK